MFKFRVLRAPVVTVFLMGFTLCAYAGSDSAIDAVAEVLKGNGASSADISSAMRILVLLTALSLIPALLIATTSFLRIIVVLSMLRHAMGMQDTPPNAALVSIAVFLTVFSMLPVWKQVDQQAWQPFHGAKMSVDEAVIKGLKPIREFMIRQTREVDLALMVELAGSAQPETMEDVGTMELVPAFMLSELRSAFQIGFMIFIPFLLIDIVIASVLTSLGMMMVPPVMISLPLKVLMFVLIDGWNLVVRSLMTSFH